MLFIFLQKILVLLTFLSFSFFIIGCSNQPIEEKKINVVFRFDDPSALSSTETEIKIIDAFREHNASITFGVIPFICAGDVKVTTPCNVVPLGPKKGKLLKKAVKEGVLDIALHGYSHQTIDTKEKREFRGLDYNSQLEKLTKGKKQLEKMIGVSPTTFVPPWNQYDSNTLKALEVLGFSTLSAAISRKAAYNSKLNFLPFTADFLELHDAVQEARTSKNKQPLIVVLLHAYDFIEADAQRGIFSFRDFNNHLDWLKSQTDIRILSIAQVIKEIKDLSGKRLQLANKNHTLEIMLPSFLKESKLLYQESPHVGKTILKIILLYLIITVIGILFSYFVGCLVFRKFTNIMTICVYGITIITIVIILYAIKDLYLHYKELVGISIFIGFAIGSWKCLIMRKKI